MPCDKLSAARCSDLPIGGNFWENSAVIPCPALQRVMTIFYYEPDQIEPIMWPDQEWGERLSPASFTTGKKHNIRPFASQILAAMSRPETRDEWDERESARRVL